jgi:hypothetical protein
MFGGISFGSPARVAADFRAASTGGQAISILRSASEWASSESNALLIPAPYRIAAAQAADYAATLRGEMAGNPYAWKAIFSPKMLALLSSRWDDAPMSLPGLFGQTGDVDPEEIEVTDDPPVEMDDAAQPADQSSALYDWLLGDWVLPDFTDPSYWNFGSFFNPTNSRYDSATPASETDAGASESTPYSFSPWSIDSADRFGGFDALDHFVLDEDSAFPYRPEYNGSFGYPLHFGVRRPLSHMMTDANAAPPAESDFENGDIGYQEEQYSIKYGQEVTTDDDSTENNAATPADDDAGETAATPQSNQDATTSSPTNPQREFADYLRYYLGIDATTDPLTPVSAWCEAAPSDFVTPTRVRTTTTILDPCTAMWHENVADSFSMSQIEPPAFDDNGTRDESDREASNDDTQESTVPDDDTASEGQQSGTLLQHFGLLFQNEANRWVDAFHRTLVQFSLVRGVF